MDSEQLMKKFPCREKVIEELISYITPWEEFPPSVYLYGLTGTGKTSIVKEFLNMMPDTKHAYINCIECYTSKIFFEKIINHLRNHKLSKTNNYQPYAKCDTFKEFLVQLQALDVEDTYVICLDNAERLRKMEHNILPCFLNLDRYSGLNITTILISQLPFDKYYSYFKGGLPDVIKIHSPQYSMNEIVKILGNNFEKVKESLKLEEEEQITLEFYENYLNLFLSVFYKACNDLPELQLISTNCFKLYIKPILSGEMDVNNVSKLWRNIAAPLKSALTQVYMRMESSTDELDCDSVKKFAQTLELPYYAKFLLIAGFLASHNSAKSDKRLFVKCHGKQKKRIQTIKANAKTVDKMSTTLGPKSFTVDRLLAIFYAILEEKVALSCNLLAQISTLVHLKFLSFISGEDNVMEGSAKLQCTVGLDFISYIGKVVGFNIRQYLSDFM